MALHGKQVPISSKNNRAARAAHARASQQFKTYDTSAIKPKKSKAPLIVGIVLAIVAIAVIIFAVITLTSKPKIEPLPDGEQAIITIDQGESAKDIAASLAEARLITDEGAFVELVKKSDAASALIPGTYVFHGGISSDDILATLMAGPESTADTLTIPEGSTRAAIADAVAAATNDRISAQDFLDASAKASSYASKYSFLDSAGKNSLEGFLFPKTYSIMIDDTAKSVVKMMLNQFDYETNSLDWSYPESKGLNIYQAVTLASIVEKEGIAENYAQIASVFYNRLASGRPYLESDATTAYEVGHDPTPEEVHANTPYSTYANKGLPPTPICNPSLEALQAVCAPAKTDYMYFYTHDDGSYVFSNTFDEHEQNYA